MKLLTLIVHTNVQAALSSLLRNLDQVSGFTFTHVEGGGNEMVKDRFVAAHDETVGYVPRIRTDLLMEEADLDIVLAAISSADIDIRGQGFYWVTSVEKGGHL